MKRAMLILGAAGMLLGVGAHRAPVSATDPLPGGPGAGSGNWTFIYPTDGMVTNQVGAFLGSASNNGTGVFSLYSHTNVNPNNVYPSELDLVYTTLVTAGAHFWTESAYEEVGDWFATIYPLTQLNGDDAPINDILSNTVVVPGFGENPASDIVMSMGGDSVHYQIIP